MRSAFNPREIQRCEFRCHFVERIGDEMSGWKRSLRYGVLAASFNVKRGRGSSASSATLRFPKDERVLPPGCGPRRLAGQPELDAVPVQTGDRIALAGRNRFHAEPAHPPSTVRSPARQHRHMAEDVVEQSAPQLSRLLAGRMKMPIGICAPQACEERRVGNDPATDTIPSPIAESISH